MPFIITTYEKVPTGVEHMGAVEMTREPVSSVAVATMMHVHDRIGELLTERGTGAVTVIDLMCVGESGGSVGPLTDGTTIEVEPGPGQQQMREDLRVWGVSMDTRDALDETIAFAWVAAYNEANAREGR